MPDNRIRLLTQQDLEFAQSLRAIAGWNQTDQDWVRMLEYSPEGCFAYEQDGQPVATATTVCYSHELAWIGMILVHPDFRRRGIATFLLEHCLNYLLNQKQVQCVKLDASAEGQTIYEKLGFKEEYALSRWGGHSKQLSDCSAQKGTWPQETLDHEAFGVNRQEYFHKLSKDSLHTLNWRTGFGMIRDGSIKKYLGPIIAKNQETGRALVTNLLNTIPSSTLIFWDIPEDNLPAVQLAEELNFRRDRSLLRMSIGKHVSSNPNLQWAISGPETG